MFVDSHCHLDRLDPASHDGSLAAALEAARARDVRQFLAIAITLEDMPRLASIAREQNGRVGLACVHPMQLLEHEPNIVESKRATRGVGAVSSASRSTD